MPIVTGVKRKPKPEGAVGRTQHVERRRGDLRPDAVALHDDEMGHTPSPFLISAVRWFAAAIRKPMSVCVVTNRTPF